MRKSTSWRRPEIGQRPFKRRILMSVALIEEIIEKAKAFKNKAEDDDQKELSLLIKDLEEAKLSVFVKTAEARPLLERCHRAVDELGTAIAEEGMRSDESKTTFSVFQKAVSKLRNTLMVRTQRAT
jgi:hypothetical protein